MKRIAIILCTMTALASYATDKTNNPPILRPTEPNITGPTDKKDGGITDLHGNPIEVKSTPGGIATASSDLIKVDTRDLQMCEIKLPNKEAWTSHVVVWFKPDKEGNGIIIANTSAKDMKAAMQYSKETGATITLIKPDSTKQIHKIADTEFRQMLTTKQPGLKPDFVIAIAQHDSQRPATSASATGAPTGTGSGS